MQAAVHGVAKSRAQLSDFTSFLFFIIVYLLKQPDIFTYTDLVIWIMPVVSFFLILCISSELVVESKSLTKFRFVLWTRMLPRC